MNGDFGGRVHGGAKNNAVARVFTAAQPRLGARIVSNPIHHVPRVGTAQSGFHILIRRPCSPHGVFSGEWGKARETGAEIPQRAWRNAALRVRTLRRMNAARPGAGGQCAPLVTMVQGLQDFVSCRGFAVKRRGE